MRQEFGEEAKHVKKSKNFLKDILNKYEAIYHQLRTAKTSQDPLAEIQNRHAVGNLWFASGHLPQAAEFWGDALATIFRKVHPIEHYHEVLQEQSPFLAQKVGLKETVLALSLLYKVSLFGCAHRLQLQKASAHFACHLGFALFEGSLEYPQTCLMYKDFRVRDFPSP
jgi:hypothetical protein